MTPLEEELKRTLMFQKNIGRVVNIDRVLDTDDTPMNPETMLANIESLNQYSNFFIEEVKELVTAIANNDYKELLDGIGDVLVILTAVAGMAGVSLHSVLKSVNESNETKFDTNVDDVSNTVKNYQNKLGVLAVYQKKLDGDFYGVFRKEDGKLLKSIHFKEPIFNILKTEKI